jgi:alanine racemase
MSPSDEATGALGGAGGLLTIDLDAIAANWRRLASKLAESGTECGAVVKADAYGLGVARVAPALWTAGCRSYFVALLDEGSALRTLLPEARIYVFNGADRASAPALAASRLIPVLNHPGQLADWNAEARKHGKPLPAMIHVDTGMNRLGLAPADVADLAARRDAFEGIHLAGVMSHLSCAEQTDHPLNREQHIRFRDALAALAPAATARNSLANSSGIFLGPDFHFDLARPGAALYGVAPQRGVPNPMAQVIRLQGKILQTRVIDTPLTVGYGATHRAERGRRIATVGVGYADGYLRSLSGNASAVLGGVRIPVVGRVSMDLITVDVTDVPTHLARPGALVDLISPDHPVDALADEAGTIAYEILTALGHRYVRRYLGGPGS